MMAPDSNTGTGSPPSSGLSSMMAGVRLLGPIREFGLELIAGAAIDRMDVVVQPCLSQGYRHLVAVWGRPSNKPIICEHAP
jgi:hypothetical protein